jgi:signal transduction histidine kinase
LRRLLGVVRMEDTEEVGRSPQPTLARLEELVAQMRATGLSIELTVEGTPRELPAGIELAAFRIVQEALTNVLKHAHATWVGLTLCYTKEALTVKIQDNGRGQPGSRSSVGRGIIGMRERVALYDGELHAGPDPNGGYQVTARLPLLTLEPT